MRILKREVQHRRTIMKDLNSKIDQSLAAKPDFGKLGKLQSDVWTRIDNKELTISSWYIPTGLKVGTFAVSILALVALTQLSLQPLPFASDILDLQVFSAQSTPSINIASINTYEFNNEY